MGKSTRFAIEHYPMPKSESGENDDQSRVFIETARAIGADESEEHFRAVLKKVARHKPREAAVTLSEILSRYGVPEGRWSHVEAEMIENVWRVTISFEDKKTRSVSLDIGGAVGISHELRAAGEVRLAERVEAALKIARSR